MDIGIVLEKNPWRRNPQEIEGDEHVQEALSRKHKLLYSFGEEENTLFVGPRRAGKTTFFKLLIRDLLLNKGVRPDDVLFVSCEVMRDHADIIDALRLLDAKYVFLDEITFVPGWEKAVKFGLDHGLLKDRVLYVTGSSTAFLGRETFPGRNIRIIPFPPMGFHRFAGVFGSDGLREKLGQSTDMEGLLPFFPEILSLFMKYLECGGFPKPAFQLMEEGQTTQENVDATYSWFRGDILKLGMSEEISKSLIARLLETLSTPVAYHSLGNYVGVSHRIVREYIEKFKQLMYLDFCYQIDEEKRLPLFRKEKKVYFADPFIVKAFEQKIVGRQVVDEPRMAELVAYNSLHSVHSNVFVHRTNGETDFWVEGKRMEVKWREKVQPRKNAIVLSKKEYNARDLVYPLPLFLLDYLGKKGGG